MSTKMAHMAKDESSYKKQGKLQTFQKRMKRYWPFYVMLFPCLIYYVIFKYGPMYGVVIAFKDFNVTRGIFGSPWANPWYKHYQYFFNSPYASQVIGNTLIISGLKLFFGLFPSLLLALLINECSKKWFGRVIQTLSYLPHFLSWVIIYGILIALFSQSAGLINTTQANFIDGTNVYDIEKAECDLRDQIYHVTEFLRGHIEGFENAYVTSSSSRLGVRETRRIMGAYVLNDEDIEKGKKFEDVVVHNAEFIVDIHHITKGGQQEDKKVPPYDIPYRCLVPKRIDHLLLAGRCISGTHRAMASYRVMNICMAIGQASGVAAALCAQKGIKPRELDYQEIQKALTTMGVNLYD